MAATAFATQYRNEFVMGFAQRQSLLRMTCTTEAVTKGNSAVFAVSANTDTASTRGVNGLIPYGQNSLSQVTATLVETHGARKVTGFNVFASQGNQASLLQTECMAIINRDIDSKILTEMATGTLETGTATTASMTLILKAWVHLLNGGVPNDGQIFAAVSPAFLGYAMRMPEFSSAKYVTVQPYVSPPAPSANTAAMSAMGTGWYEWMNIKWIVHPNISGIGTSTERCFMYHRSAIGHAVNTNEMDVRVGYDDEQDYSWSRATVYHGAKILQDTGIVEMTHDGSAFVAS